MGSIINNPHSQLTLDTINDILTNQSSGALGAVLTDPLNIFIIAAATTMLTGIGLSYIAVGKNKGNIDSLRGSLNVLLFSAPIGTLLYFIFGAYYIQSYIYPNGYFVSVELFPIYFTLLWALLFINQFVALILTAILKKIMPN